MRDCGIGSVESTSARFSIFVHSLEDYINEVAVSNQGTSAHDVSKQINNSIQKSVEASIDYHDYMSDVYHNNGDSRHDAHHKVMAGTYRALRMI